MKFTTTILIILAAAGGWGVATFLNHVSTAPAVSRKIVMYQSPMHPWVKSEAPGQCTVCGMDLVPIYEGERGFDNAVPGVVMLPASTVIATGLQTEEVKEAPLIRTLKVAGSIGEDESRHGVISAPVEGRIDGLAMSCEGQVITRRQPLATMFSRTLLSAAKDYSLAVTQNEASAMEQSKRRLEQYGLVWEQINAIPQRQPDDQYFGILAPLTGTIMKSYVAEGQYVKEGDKLFEIADFNKMWFQFSVSEQDLPMVEKEQIVTVQPASQPGSSLKGRINFISPNLDPRTRSSMVRVVLENPERKLKNNSRAEGAIEISSPPILTVPRKALVWQGTDARVYVEKSPGSFAARNLLVGRTGDCDCEVLSGLKKGERVVVSGAVLLDGQADLQRNAAGK